MKFVADSRRRWQPTNGDPVRQSCPRTAQACRKLTIIELGPEAGKPGGHSVAAGTPEQVARHKKSYTGQALAKVLPRAGVR